MAGPSLVPRAAAAAPTAPPFTPDQLPPPPPPQPQQQGDSGGEAHVDCENEREREGRFCLPVVVGAGGVVGGADGRECCSAGDWGTKAFSLSPSMRRAHDR
jgi:hypothetical protein